VQVVLEGHARVTALRLRRNPPRQPDANGLGTDDISSTVRSNDDPREISCFSGNRDIRTTVSYVDFVNLNNKDSSDGSILNRIESIGNIS